MQREESVYNHDFLDSVSEDLPKHTWSILKDGTETVANLRSLLWPGFYAYHKVNTGSHFGSIYIGDGIRSNDLPFMI
jgi:radial spoke head protein 9